MTTTNTTVSKSVRTSNKANKLATGEVTGKVITTPRKQREPKAIVGKGSKGVSPELAQARADYLSCMGGKSVLGGGPWVGVCPRELELINNSVLNDAKTLIDALAKMNSKQALAWAGSKMRELDKAARANGKPQSDSAHANLTSFSQFLAGGGYEKLVKSLRILFPKHRHFSESMDGVKYTIDVLVDLNNMFGLKLTNIRRARKAEMAGR